MEGYTSFNAVCAECGISPTSLKKLISKGLVRFKTTQNIVTRKTVRWVHIQDTKDALIGVFPVFIEINQETEPLPATVRTVKYHIQNGRFRWKREGRILYVSKEDIEAFYTHTAKSRKTPS